MAETLSFAARRARVVSRTAPLLAGLVALSAVIRSVVAWRHTIPRLFPDEYIYEAIGRSIGHGHLQIRGQTMHFPALLEPILAAPIWRSFDLGTAYHLVQTENAVAASLAAIPAYLLARSLKLSSAYALGTAVYVLLVPELVLIAYTSSDAVAYPLALSAIYLGVLALDTGERRHQVGFLVFASLATFARVEYVALVAAYLIGAAAIERRQIWRRHRIALATIVPVAIVFLVGFLGYYANERNTPLNAGYFKWFTLQVFLYVVATGTIMIPGAVAAMTTPRTRRELSFSVFGAALAVLLLAEATAHAANSSQFKERYLFVLSVLVPVAFGLYLKHGRPRRLLVLAIAAAVVIAAARFPLSEYATASFKMDSQFLFAVSYGQTAIGTANAALLAAAVTTLGAAAAVVLAFRGGAAISLFCIACFAVVVTALATHEDLRETKQVRVEQPRDLRWVDHLARGPVDAIETAGALRQDLLYQLYWNGSIKRELLFGRAEPTDAFSTPKLQVGRDGTLENTSNEVLFHYDSTTGWPQNAAVVGHAGGFELWRARAREPIRLRLAIEGRLPDGWLTDSGTISAWARSGGAVSVMFRLSLPGVSKAPSTVHLGKTTFRLRPGTEVAVRCGSGTGPLSVPFSATPTVANGELQTLSVRLDHISVRDQSPPMGSSASQCDVTAQR